MIQLRFDDLRRERHGLSADELLLGVVAKFALFDDEVELYSEVDFPVVELAAQLRAWMSTKPLAEFQFDSMESAQLGLVRFKLQGAQIWTAGSDATGRWSKSYSEADLLAEAKEFTDRVVGRCASSLGVDVSGIVQSFFPNSDA